MTQIKSRLRLKAKMKNMLVGAGTEGLVHSDIVQKCRTRVFPAEDVREILQDWNTRKLVQCFEVKKAHSKKPVMVWRATTLIITERL